MEFSVWVRRSYVRYPRLVCLEEDSEAALCGVEAEGEAAFFPLLPDIEPAARQTLIPTTSNHQVRVRISNSSQYKVKRGTEDQVRKRVGAERF